MRVFSTKSRKAFDLLFGGMECEQYRQRHSIIIKRGEGMNGKQWREKAAGIVAGWKTYYSLITRLRNGLMSRNLFIAEWRSLQKGGGYEK
jgi:hypothetical protein